MHCSICRFIYTFVYLSSCIELVATESTYVFEDIDFTYKLGLLTKKFILVYL